MTVTNSEPSGSSSGYDAPPLVVAVTEEPSTWVIDVQGELDLLTSPLVKQHLEVYKDERRDDGHPRKLVYSLSELDFIDATGLRALLTAVDGHGPETIAIREPSSVVRRLLELVELDSMIEPTTQPIGGTVNPGFKSISSAFLGVDLLKSANEVVVLFC